MASPKKKTERTDFDPAIFDPNQVNFKEVSSNIQIWPFDKKPTLYCKIVGTEDLEHTVWVIIDMLSGRKYYLPQHQAILEAVQEHGEDNVFKITRMDKVNYKDGKRSYYVYDIFVAE